MNDGIYSSFTSLVIFVIIYAANCNEVVVVIPSIVQNLKLSIISYLFKDGKFYEKIPNQLKEKLFMAASSMTQ